MNLHLSNLQFRSEPQTHRLLATAITLALAATFTVGPTRFSLAATAVTPVNLSSFEIPGTWSPGKTESSGDGAEATIVGAGPSTHPIPASRVSLADPTPASTLKVDLTLPASAAIHTTPDAAWNGVKVLGFSVYLPPDAPPSMSLGVYVKDNEWLWYQAFPLRGQIQPNGMEKPELIPGQWNPVVVDLRSNASGWAPGGHTKPWVIAMRPFLQFGIIFYSKTPYKGQIEISPLHGWVEPDSPLAPLRVDMVYLYPGVKSIQWQPVGITIHINRHYKNPFDPEEVDVEGTFNGPMGHVQIPGFIYQDYKLNPGSIVPTPEGDEYWKVRFMPTLPGPYTYSVVLKDSTGAYTLASGHFDCSPHKDRGFVRISKRDPRYFAFDNHSFYYPVGLNVRHAGDKDNVHMGLPTIEHYFDEMGKVGLTWTRTWMCSWWLAIEWTHSYDARYHGVGYYNLANAWLLDQTLASATKNGLYVDLTLNNHGQFSSKSDPEWAENPYNVANGGKLAEPKEFFTDPWAIKMFEQRLRYIIARWGYDPHIMAWEMFNEIDLTEGYNSHVVSQWLSEMAHYIHSIDYYQHLVTTHVCWWTQDPVIWSNPDVQFVQADGYVRWVRKDGDIMATFTPRIWKEKERFGKPAYIVEFGYKQSPTELDPSCQFHTGTWAGIMSPFSGASMYWDWYVVEQRDFWPQYAAVVRFVRGEDRRNQDLNTMQASATGPEPIGINTVGNTNRAYVYAYVYSRNGLWNPDGLTPVDGVKLTLNGLSDGMYHVEFWDTFKGVITGTSTISSANGQMIIPLPPLAIDVAMKIKRVDSNGT